jgi:hypothetical protein
MLVDWLEGRFRIGRAGRIGLAMIAGFIRLIGISILCLMIRGLMAGIFLMMINTFPIRCLGLGALGGNLNPFIRNLLCGTWIILGINVQIAFQPLLRNNKSQNLKLHKKISNFNKKITKFRLKYKFKNQLSPKNQVFLHNHTSCQCFYKCLMRFIAQAKK